MTTPLQLRATLRFDRLDAVRGFALVWMAVFHFCFDLAHKGLIAADFYADPFWTTQRTCILSLFLLCAGAGQAVAVDQRQSWRRFWRRWAQIVGCAALVSAGSWWMFADSFIYFGVLHGMAVMLIVVRLSAPLRGWLWPLGAVAMWLPSIIQHPFFDLRTTNWMGLVTHKPITEDYVPVLPWLGLMWWGMAGTQWVLARHRHWLSARTRPADDNADHPFALTAGPQLLAALGRWSLTFYMLHQPVLIGALSAWIWWRGLSF